MLLPVLVQTWQMECCGEPFSVGDRVRWGLTFSPATAQLDIPAERLVQLDVQASRPPSSPIVLTAGPLTLYWSSPDEHEGLLRIRGTIHEDHHAEFPAGGIRTEGVVRHIQLASAPGHAVPPREVKTCPRTFRRGEVGVLVDFEIGDPAT